MTQTEFDRAFSLTVDAGGVFIGDPEWFHTEPNGKDLATKYFGNKSLRNEQSSRGRGLLINADDGEYEMRLSTRMPTNGMVRHRSMRESLYLHLISGELLICDVYCLLDWRNRFGDSDSEQFRYTRLKPGKYKIELYCYVRNAKSGEPGSSSQLNARETQELNRIIDDFRRKTISAEEYMSRKGLLQQNCQRIVTGLGIILTDISESRPSKKKRCPLEDFRLSTS